MQLELKTKRQTFVADRRWEEPVFMVRMGGTTERRYHLIDPSKNATGEFGRIYHSLCGADYGDWRSVQYGDLPFLGWLCGKCAQIGSNREMISEREKHGK